MARKVRVGVIGTSWWADTMYFPSLKSHPAAEVAAICGRNRDRAVEMAGKYGIPQVFTDYQAMFEQGNLEAVVVSTPDDLHYPMTMAALEAGLNVLCEKPLSGNARQAREMYEKAARAGVKHMVMFTWRWQPHFRYLKQLLDEGYLGRCYHAEFSIFGSYGRNPEYQWRFDGQRANGILGDLGSHVIDLARWYLGEVRSVSARLATYLDHPGVEGGRTVPANDAALVTLELGSGAQVFVQASGVTHQADRGFGIKILLYGEAGTLEAEHIYLGSEAGVTLRGARQDDAQFRRLTVPAEIQEDIAVGDIFGPYLKQSAGARLFIDGILEDRAIIPNFYDGFKVQEVVDAALQSHREGRVISL